MSRTTITDLIAVCAIVCALALFATFILVPAWNAHSRIWQRLAAAFMSLYVLVACVGIGVAAALAAVYFWG